eukprot:867223-Pelagomonas_calceolata.AAC.6
MPTYRERHWRIALFLEIAINSEGKCDVLRYMPIPSHVTAVCQVQHYLGYTLINEWRACTHYQRAPTAGAVLSTFATVVQEQRTQCMAQKKCCHGSCPVVLPSSSQLWCTAVVQGFEPAKSRPTMKLRAATVPFRLHGDMNHMIREEWHITQQKIRRCTPVMQDFEPAMSRPTMKCVQP